MAVQRSPSTQQIPLNIVGSSTFGRYPTIDAEYTYNMFQSQKFLTSYLGYKIGIRSFDFNSSTSGRGIYNSTKLNSLVVVMGSFVYLVKIKFDQLQQEIISGVPIFIGELQSAKGPVFISENNKPQICISDNEALYIYDPQATKFSADISSFTVSPGNVITYIGGRELIPGEEIVFSTTGTLPTGITAGTIYFVSSDNIDSNKFSVSTNLTNAKQGINIDLTGTTSGSSFATQGEFQRVETDFTPGQITFHDTYFISVASDDTFFSPAANNTWRLSEQNNGFIWANDSASIGLLETKPDNTQGVIRFPSGGNMILVLGDTVTEAWYDTGAQLFPYQRNNQYNIDYGCVSPESIAQLDTIAVWLGFNEQTGPLIIYSEGGLPKPLLSDGIDYKLSQLQKPEDCSAWMYRQDGHLIYHINFYTDNYSLFYDFNLKKFYNASDQDMNYYHISKMVYFGLQYYGISPNDGNLYIVDTTITNYQTVDKAGNNKKYIIPRLRSCASTRLSSQNYFIANDVGFTIESGEDNYEYQRIPDSDGIPFKLVSIGGDNIVSMSADQIVSNTLEPGTETFTFYEMIPRAYLSISRNGGETYSSEAKKELRTIGLRKNKLQWWGLGVANDLVCKFRFETFGRVVVSNGILNIRK